MSEVQKLFIAFNPNKPYMAYDMPHLFTQDQMKEATDRVEALNERGRAGRDGKGWKLIEMENI